MQNFRSLINPTYTANSSNEIQQSDFSYISLNYNGNDFIYVLSKIDEHGVETWIGPYYETIKTFKGLIIFTDGFENDIFLDKQSQENIIKFFPTSSFNYKISLKNPLLLNELVEYELVAEKTEQEKCSYLIYYRRIISSIKSKSSDYFCFDSNGMVSESILKIDPRKSKLKLKFNYIY